MKGDGGDVECIFKQRRESGVQNLVWDSKYSGRQWK